MRVMIVDDNAGMREMVRDASCTDEDVVLECPDGETAVNSYAPFAPDVVLLDIELKELDGFMAAERIYAIDPSARIVFVTSHNTSAFRLKAKRLHAAGFVSKDNVGDVVHLLRGADGASSV